MFPILVLGQLTGIIDAQPKQLLLLILWHFYLLKTFALRNTTVVPYVDELKGYKRFRPPARRRNTVRRIAKYLGITNPSINDRSNGLTEALTEV